MVDTTPQQATRWSVIALVIASGILASASMGKVPPSLDLLRGEFSIGLVFAGWIVSVFSALAMATGAGLAHFLIDSARELLSLADSGFRWWQVLLLSSPARPICC